MMIDGAATKLSDEELFVLFKDGDNQVFEALYKRYRSYLVEIAERKLLSREIAEDVVQEIFLSLNNRRTEIEIQVPLSGFSIN